MITLVQRFMNDNHLSDKVLCLSEEDSLIELMDAHSQRLGIDLDWSLTMRDAHYRLDEKTYFLGIAQFTRQGEFTPTKISNLRRNYPNLSLIGVIQDAREFPGSYVTGLKKAAELKGHYLLITERPINRWEFFGETFKSVRGQYSDPKNVHYFFDSATSHHQAR